MRRPWRVIFPSVFLLAALAWAAPSAAQTTLFEQEAAKLRTPSRASNSGSMPASPTVM